MPTSARLLALSALILSAAIAPAQSPSAFPDTPGVIPSEWSTEAAARPTQRTSDSHYSWHIDFLFGLPLGVRVQRDLGDSPWACEGFVGLVGIDPSVGIGFRRRCVLLQGSSDVLMLSPGVDAYLSAIVDFSGIGNAMGGGGGDSGLGGRLAGDVDLLWCHYRHGGELRLGLKVGGVVGSGGPLPVLSAYFGWGF